MSENVILKPETLSNLFFGSEETTYNLKIPDYQRIYCWEEKQVIRLLEDIRQYADKTYHLGSIILHKRNNNDYDIVDGQQRLVTLSLLLLYLGKDDFVFLGEKFESEQAQHYIAYNKWFIQNYISLDLNNFRSVDEILKNLRFSVLILETESLDLAYTFFTSENGRGKPLSIVRAILTH